MRWQCIPDWGELFLQAIQHEKARPLLKLGSCDLANSALCAVQCASWTDSEEPEQDSWSLQTVLPIPILPTTLFPIKICDAA
ncbi:hypothetical protein MHYP_G00299890 [Metynnis hypsauchen]